MNKKKLYWCRICFSYFNSNLNISYTLWSYALSSMATGCCSSLCKECQTQYSVHSKLSYTMAYREKNVLFKSSSKLCDTSLELLYSRSLWQWECQYTAVSSWRVRWVELTGWRSFAVVYRWINSKLNSCKCNTVLHKFWGRGEQLILILKWHLNLRRIKLLPWKFIYIYIYIYSLSVNRIPFYSFFITLEIQCITQAQNVK